MNPHNRTIRRLLAASLAALLSAGLAGLAARPSQAHEAKCPICKLDVPQDTEKQDNEVALRSGRKRIEYRCVFCALSDSKAFQADLTVLAPSELKGKPVLLTRKDGKWTAAPETAVFVGEKVNHRQCQLGYRAFTGKPAFEKWVAANADLLKDARPLTLQQMLEVSGAGK
jgi:hypothetical protein